MRNAVALGTFDGLHTAHLRVLDATLGYNRLTVTFKTPPKQFFSSSGGLLMAPERKLEALRELGIGRVITLDFEKVKDIEAQDFLNYLYDEFNPALISCGFNYRFGRGAAGDTELLKHFCREKGIELCVCEGVMHGDKTLSSSLLRSYIANGEVDKANSLIYGGFRIASPVIQGDKRGRMMNFPTANQQLPQELVAPRFGVYAAEVEIDGLLYRAVTNIGIRPTFKLDSPICETHILGFSGDVYGRRIILYPKKFLREERQFGDISELKAQIAEDISRIRNM